MEAGVGKISTDFGYIVQFFSKTSEYIASVPPTALEGAYGS